MRFTGFEGLGVYWNKRKYPAILLICSLISACILIFSRAGRFDISGHQTRAAAPRIEPDYSDLVIPPNIAPLNFIVQEKGERFVVEIYTDGDSAIRIESTSPKIQIPLKPWQSLLRRSRGGTLFFDVYAYTSVGGWIRYHSMTNRIAAEPVDRYLVYRYLRPNYTVQKEMNIRQRDLENYDETLVMTTKTNSGCVNCHAFKRHDPSSMLMHLRWGPAAGTLLAQNGTIVKIDTRTDFNPSPGAYPSWHPCGEVVAFSVNRVFQFFHAIDENRDVIDLSSDLIVYNIKSNTVSSHPDIASPSFMETFPAWSPGGEYLYFCRAPQLDPDFSLERDYRNIKYDLVRIAYDAESGHWGGIDTLITAAGTELSCSQPRVSPDGKHLLLCMSGYGSFPIFRPDADLYALSLDEKRLRRLNVNSDAPEGSHCWSSNSRWIVFASKRDNGLFTRLYISYMDEQGAFHKPFILPLKDPEDYQILMRTFSVPELIKEPVPFSARQFVDAALDPERERKAELDPGTRMMTTVPDSFGLATTDYP